VRSWRTVPEGSLRWLGSGHSRSSEEGNHSTASEGDVLRKYILDAGMFNRGRGKDHEGRQPLMHNALPGESTEDPEEPVGNDEGQEGSRKDHRATTCSLGRLPSRLRLWKDVTALEISTSSTEPVGLRTSHISDGERLANDRPSGNRMHSRAPDRLPVWGSCRLHTRA
jgi:hypothetical protein